MLKVSGQRRENHYRLAVPGMPEAQGTGVEALAVLTQLCLFMTVDGISQNGVTDVGHMNTDLVGASRFQAAADVGVAPIAADHFPVGHGVFWSCGR